MQGLAFICLLFGGWLSPSCQTLMVPRIKPFPSFSSPVHSFFFFFLLLFRAVFSLEICNLLKLACFVTIIIFGGNAFPLRRLGFESWPCPSISIMYGREPGTFATMAFFLSFFFVSCQEHLPPRGERKKRFHVVFDCRCFCATGAPVCISHLDDRCYWNPALALPLGQVSFSLLLLLRKKNESWRFFCGSGTCAWRARFLLAAAPG